ncbi:MAG: hypothetical protein ACI379_06900 [Nocardioides sp.]|uniref:hypothetical protein n=1 Tax=Nocardioides sp. TaxID=35761 RepID=UPI003F04F0D0
MDEYPIHQAPLPVTWAVSSDRNVYDRCYLMAHDRSGEVMVISGLGYYPNLGVKDAFLAVRRRTQGRDETTVVHLSDLIDDDRLRQGVGTYSIDVVEPLQTLRLTLADTEGISADLTWTGSYPVVQELPHVMRAGSRVTLDAQRFAQVGTWAGTLTVDGEEIVVDPATWVGTRDRSWGIRPSGEAPPAGAPLEPAFDGMWWLYVPLRFDDFAVVLIIQEEPDGHRTLNDCTRVWPDGRREQLGWPRVQIRYEPGSRTATSATITCTTPTGDPVVLEVDSLLAAPLHVGCGYGGDPDWAHGAWRGPEFAERLTYDMASPEVQGRLMFGMVDHVGRAVLREEGQPDRTGWGLFEHGVLGRHDPSGFADWFTLAP